MISKDKNLPAVVYRVIHNASGHFYIGCTCKQDARWKRHWRELKNGNHPNAHLRQLSAVSSDVRKDFSIEVVAEFANLLSAIDAESLAIRQSSDNPLCLNILLPNREKLAGDALTRNPNRGNILKRRTATQRESLANMTLRERKDKWGKTGELNPMYGKTHSPEARALISAANLGNTNGKGRKNSLEHRAKISERARERVGDKNSFFGKKHSDATKEKLRQANKGKLPKNSRRISVDGVEYPSIKAAAAAVGVSSALIAYRIRSSKYDYNYCE